MSLLYKFICKGPNTVNGTMVSGAKCLICNFEISTEDDSCPCGNLHNDKAVVRFSAKQGKKSFKLITKPISYKVWGGFPITHAKCPSCNKLVKISGGDGCDCGNITVDKNMGRFSVSCDETQIELYAKRTPAYLIYKIVCIFDELMDFFV